MRRRLAGSRKRPKLRMEVVAEEVTRWKPSLWIGVTSVALADELHRRGFPAWYPDGRPVNFIEDDWYDDFPLVWRDGWFSTAA